jgi:hypothetical protein
MLVTTSQASMSRAPSRRMAYVAEWLFVGPRRLLAQAAPQRAVTTPSQPVQRARICSRSVAAATTPTMGTRGTAAAREIGEHDERVRAASTIGRGIGELRAGGCA